MARSRFGIPASGARVARLAAVASYALALAFSQDESVLAVGGSSDQSISLWNTATWQKEGLLAGHRDGVWCLAFTADGGQLVSSSRDGTVKIWRTQANRVPETSREPRAIIGFSPDSQVAAVLSPAP